MKTNNNIIAALVMNSAIALSLTASLQAATRTITFGDSWMGATLTGTMGHTITPKNDAATFYSSGRAVGTVLKKSFDLASVSSNLTFNAGSTKTKAWGYLRAGSATILPWEKSMTGTADFTTPPKKVTLKAGLDLEVLTLGAGITIEVKAAGKVTNNLDSNGRSVMTATFGPSADLAVLGNARVYIPALAWGSLDAKVSLGKLGLNSDVRMTPFSDRTQQMYSNVTYSQTVRMETLSGTLTAKWGGIALPNGSKVISWNGLSTTKLLGTGAFTLKKTPIVQLN